MSSLQVLANMDGYLLGLAFWLTLVLGGTQINELRSRRLRYPTIEILDRQIRISGDVAVVAVSAEALDCVEGS